MGPRRGLAHPRELAGWALGALLSTTACEAVEAKPSVVPPARDTAPGPPDVKFVAPRAWHPHDKPDQLVPSPEPAAERWRVLAHQHTPMQKATPHWLPLPSTRTVEVELPSDAGFRCVVTPLSVEPEANDFDTELEGWKLERQLLCSTDEFRTWQAHPHRVRIDIDGTRERSPARASLRARGVDGRVRETLVVVRDEPERRQASTGPPTVLP